MKITVFVRAAGTLHLIYHYPFEKTALDWKRLLADSAVSKWINTLHFIGVYLNWLRATSMFSLTITVQWKNLYISYALVCIHALQLIRQVILRNNDAQYFHHVTPGGKSRVKIPLKPNSVKGEIKWNKPTYFL